MHATTTGSLGAQMLVEARLAAAHAALDALAAAASEEPKELLEEAKAKAVDGRHPPALRCQVRKQHEYEHASEITHKGISIGGTLSSQHDAWLLSQLKKPHPPLVPLPLPAPDGAAHEKK